MKTKRRNWIGNTLALCALAFTLAGCSTIDKGADPIEVRAEQTISIATTTLDTFMTLELKNEALVKEKAPEAYKVAVWLAAPVTVDGKTLARGLSLIQSATNARRAYKSSRGPEAKANLEAALSALAAAVAETTKQLGKIPK